MFGSKTRLALYCGISNSAAVVKNSIALPNTSAAILLSFAATKV